MRWEHAARFRMNTSCVVVQLCCEAIYLKQAVSGLVTYFHEIKPDLVVYCPHLSAFSHLVARHLKIRSVSLLSHGQVSDLFSFPSSGPVLLFSTVSTHGIVSKRGHCRAQGAWTKS